MPPPPNSIYAQAGQAEVTGNITDESGAGIAGASVNLLDVSTNVTTVVLSGDDGGYVATNLRPGVYTLNIEPRPRAGLPHGERRVY